MAAGLLHPFSGAHARLNRLGMEGMVSTKKLLDAATLILNEDVIKQTGILRLALSLKQCEDYLKCSRINSSFVSWESEESCQKKYPYLEKAPGIWISSGLYVDCELYLKGLWRICEKKGTVLEKIKIEDIQELHSFDHIIIAAGYGSKDLFNLPISGVKGQLLKLEWPKSLPVLPFSLNSQAYLCRDMDPNFCYAGATFERNFSNEEIDVVEASKEIVPKVKAMIPSFDEIKVVECKAGIRVSTLDHMPIAKQLNEKVWCLTGMGSKGLLYHSLFAENLVRSIFSF